MTFKLDENLPISSTAILAALEPPFGAATLPLAQGSRACANGDSARSRRQWRVQRYRIGLHWCERPPRFAHTAAVSRSVADPDCHDVPAMEPTAGNGGLINDNSVQQWLRGVGVWSSEQESAIMAEQPGVQGLHAAEVRNLDEFWMRRLRAHKATPQGQDTTVSPGRRRSLSCSIRAADARRKAGRWPQAPPATRVSGKAAWQDAPARGPSRRLPPGRDERAYAASIRATAQRPA